MSTLKAVTLQHTDGTSPTTLTGQSAAKVWCKFTTVTTTSLSGDFGVTSLTDNGTADTDINLTATMNDANYCTNATCNFTDSGSLNMALNIYESGTYSTSAVQVLAQRSDGVQSDRSINCVTIHGDLA